MQNFGQVKWPIIGSFSVLILLIGTLIIAIVFPNSNAGPELIDGLAVIVGVSVLILSLFLIATGFSALSLNDKNQALGLPDGSIRAIIALLLIVVWIIVSIFLFTFTALPPNATPLSPDAIRFSQGFYSTMSTLVVAVVAFYFGSKSTATKRKATVANDATTSGSEKSLRPTISSITPEVGVRGQTIDRFTINGANFKSPKSVRLIRDAKPEKEEIIATNILSNSSLIICTITIKNDQSQGKWDIVVVNEDGGECQRANMFTI